MCTQPSHRPHAQRGPDGQRHERVSPAERVDPIRHEMNRRQSEREAERGLHGEHRADARRIRELGD